MTRNNKYSKLLLFLAIATTLIRCEEAEITPKDHPFVTMENVSTSISGATFSAKVSSLGVESILSHGFVWGNQDSLDIEYNDHIFLNSNITIGSISVEINSGFIKDEIYYVRPFVETENIFVYGSVLSFISEGSNPPEILDFQPKFGPKGTQVEISGINFGYSGSSNTVKFGNYTAQIDSATNTKLYVKVPQVTEPGEVDISVETAEMLTSSSDKFDLYFPWLKKGSSHSINFGSTNFTFGDNAYFINKNSSSISVFNVSGNSWSNQVLPENSGDLPLSVSIEGKSYILLEDNFWEYDIELSTWRVLSNFPEVRIYDPRYTFSIRIGNMIGIGSLINDQYFWTYDPILDTWNKKENFPGNLGQRPWENFTCLINNTPLIGMKADYVSQFWKYNLDNHTWSEIGDLPIDAHADWAQFIIDNELFLGLGSTSEYSNGYVSNRIWKYDPLIDSWTEYQECPTRMGVISSFSFNGKGYFLSGYTKFGDSLREIWEFNPNKN